MLMSYFLVSSLTMFNYAIETCMMLSVMSMLYLLTNWPFTYSSTSWLLSMDFISYNMIILSLWIIVMSMLASITEKWAHKNYFNLCNIVLMTFLFMSFSAKSYLLFYIFFEASLIPILMIILGWGYQPERTLAGIYMLFYTLFASLPLLGLIFFLNTKMGTSDMMLKTLIYMNPWMYLTMVAAFLVKFPMYMVHIWLPKAHVEAPVSGSMILAGVLLKLGGYGLMRFLPLLIKLNSEYIKYLLVSTSLMGGLFISMICLRQMDMKMLIAYSSVCHMASCISSLLILGELAMKGSLFMMVAHGLCSSGLFYLVDVVYKRTNTRTLLINKGLLNILPTLSFWWFMLLVANLAGPPSMNLMSEICMITNLVAWNKMNSVMIMLIIFMTGAYSMFIYSMSQHNKYLFSLNSVKTPSFLNFFILLNHLIPLNIMILSVWSFN
uniref:NADH-ubiquinone oxidoreductase chain 4 n=1 Tax=Metacrangonyx dhofarensis TaxID=2291046 RepID=A0A345UDK5_9CRUS|nr:NADH dehydrogenase subunit 4 [Metacrangonyx dhofarensis]